MDGTRVIRVVELYHDQYLVGKALPPDIRCFPSPDELVKQSVGSRSRTMFCKQEIKEHMLQKHILLICQTL